MVVTKDDAHISVRIDSKIKQDVQDELAKRGLSLSAYIKMMLRDVAENHRVLYPSDVPRQGGEVS